MVKKAKKVVEKVKRSIPESEQWVSENTDKEPEEKKTDIVGKEEAESVKPRITESMSKEEISAAQKVSVAAMRQVECNMCVHDKLYKHDIYKCEKYIVKKDCVYLNKYIK